LPRQSVVAGHIVYAIGWLAHAITLRLLRVGFIEEQHGRITSMAAIVEARHFTKSLIRRVGYWLNTLNCRYATLGSR